MEAFSGRRASKQRRCLILKVHRDLMRLLIQSGILIIVAITGPA
jgi:hypothetical protein